MVTCASFVEYTGRYFEAVRKLPEEDGYREEYVQLDGNDGIYQWFKQYANGQNLAEDRDDFRVSVPKEVLQELLNKLEECCRLVRQIVKDCLGLDLQCDKAYVFDLMDPMRGIKELLEQFDWQNKTLYYDWSPT